MDTMQTMHIIQTMQNMHNTQNVQEMKCPKKNIFLQDGFPYMLGKPKMKKVFFRLTEFFRDYGAN